MTGVPGPTGPPGPRGRSGEMGPAVSQANCLAVLFINLFRLSLTARAVVALGVFATLQCDGGVQTHFKYITRCTVFCCVS